MKCVFLNGRPVRRVSLLCAAIVSAYSGTITQLNAAMVNGVYQTPAKKKKNSGALSSPVKRVPVTVEAPSVVSTKAGTQRPKLVDGVYQPPARRKCWNLQAETMIEKASVQNNATPTADAGLKKQLVKDWIQALEAAYLFNPDIKNGLVELRLAQEGLKEAFSTWLPDVNLSADTSASRSERLNKSKPYPEGFNKKNRDSALGFELSQNLFEGGATRARVKKSRKLVAEKEELFLARVSSVLSKVLEAYVDVCVAQYKLSFDRQYKARAENLFNQAQERFKVGEITSTQVSLAEAQFIGSDVQERQARADLASKRAALKSLIGSELANSLPWPDMQFDAKMPIEKVLKDALKNNQNLLAGRFKEKAGHYGVNEKIGTALAPQLNFQGSFKGHYRKATTQAGGDLLQRTQPHYRTLEGRLNLRIPVPLGRQQAGVRSAEQQFAQARLARQKTQLDIRSAVVKAYYDLQVAFHAVKQYVLEVEAYRKTYEGMQEEVLLGQRTEVDLTDVQNKWRDAQLKLYQAKKSRIMSIAGLQQLMGEFTAVGLKLAVPYYRHKDYDKWFSIGIDE